MVWEQHLEDNIQKYKSESLLIDSMVLADWRNTQNWDGPPNR